MASIRRQKSGRWRVQVRRKGRALSETFVRYDDAKVWAVEAEREIDRGESPRKSRISKLTTFGDLIDLHIADMKEVGKAPGRSKDATLKMLKRVLGKRRLAVSFESGRFNKGPRRIKRLWVCGYRQQVDHRLGGETREGG